MVTRDTHYHPNHPHLDTRDAPLISGLPQGRANDTPIRIHVTRLSYPDYLKEVQATLINIRHPDDFHLIFGLPQGSSNDTYKHKTSGRLSQYIRMTNICHSDMIVRVIDWSEQVLHVIATACHGPRSATCRVKGWEWSDGKSLPTITYHNFWQSQHLPRSLSAARRVMMAQPPPSVIMTTQNISLPLKRETKLLILYIWTFTQRGR